MRTPSGLRIDSPSWPLLQALISYWGTTDNDGNVAGTTIRCGGLATEPPYENHALKILTGPSAGQTRDLTLHPAGTDTLTVANAFTNVTGAPQQILAGTKFVVLSKTPAIAEVAALTALVVALIADVGATEHETEWATIAVVEQIANAAAVALTAGQIIPTFPAGSTRVRAILIASIHAANQAANTHHIDLKVQGQIDAGGYGDLLDLTAAQSLGLVNLDGAADGLAVAVDVTALVTTSGSTYDFRFQVDSDNAGAVNYTTSFVLVLVYTM